MPYTKRKTDIQGIARCVRNINRILGADIKPNPLDLLENRMIRIITLTWLVFVAFTVATTASAQPIVTSAYFLEWDNPNPAGAIDETRIYLSATPNITPDGNPTGVVTGDVNRWAITAAPGTYYAVVTFKATGPDNAEIETPPSNEITFIVIGSPSNLRITQ